MQATDPIFNSLRLIIAKFEPTQIRSFREKVKTHKFASFTPNCKCNTHHFYQLVVHCITKACEISARSLKELSSKGEKSVKNA